MTKMGEQSTTGIAYMAARNSAHISGGRGKIFRSARVPSKHWLMGSATDTMERLFKQIYKIFSIISIILYICCVYIYHNYRLDLLSFTAFNYRGSFSLDIEQISIMVVNKIK